MHTTTWKTKSCVLRFALSALVAFEFSGTSVWAQQTDTAPQVTGTPGSPSATTTIDGKQLPAPDPEFGGVIKQGALKSKAWWALYHDGWLLSTKVNRAPWGAFGAANPDPLNNQVLELYDLNTDFSQSQNIADEHSDRVQELKQMFIEEAKKYQVFPLDASVAARIVAPRPNITAGRTEFVYTRPMTGLPQDPHGLLRHGEVHFH